MCFVIFASCMRNMWMYTEYVCILVMFRTCHSKNETSSQKNNRYIVVYIKHKLMVECWLVLLKVGQHAKSLAHTHVKPSGQTMPRPGTPKINHHRLLCFKCNIYIDAASCCTRHVPAKLPPCQILSNHGTSVWTLKRTCSHNKTRNMPATQPHMLMLWCIFQNCLYTTPVYIPEQKN